MKKIILLLLLSVFLSCSIDEGPGNDKDGCTSNMDCPVGMECNFATGECEKENNNGLPDNDTAGNAKDCSGHGKVNSSNECDCYEGYDGSNCERCDEGYTGYPDCEQDGVCAGIDCNDHGKCLEAIKGCSCYTGYDGEFCDECMEGYEGYPDCVYKLCEPGDKGCRGDMVVTCNEDGTEFVDTATCDAEGITCYKGKCLDECGIAAEDKSYVGCEYWGTFLQQGGGYEANATYALVVANPNDTEVNVKIYTSGDTLLTEGNIAAEGLHSFELGKDRRIPGPGISDLGLRIVSTRPVTVTQMNPFGNVLMYSNDATLLIPSGALTGDYYAMSWPGWNSLSGFISIIATEDGQTTVKAVYTGTSIAGSGVNAENPGNKVTYTLNKYQVLTLNSTKGGDNSFGADLSGSFISADKKVAVFGGHVCTRIPANQNACDHMEHQMFPLQTWGKNFVAARTKPRGNEQDYFRIMASENDTTVSWTGGLTGSTTLQAGWFHELSTTADFKISSDKPIMVGQFLASQDAGAGTGDPAMMLLAPDEQLRTDYIFLVPPNYDNNRVTIVAQKDTEIVMNETSYSSSSFVQIPGTEWYKGWVDVSTGVYNLKANKPVGLYVYGFSSYVSYAYTAGLDLKEINLQQ